MNININKIKIIGCSSWACGNFYHKGYYNGRYLGSVHCCENAQEAREYFYNKLLQDGCKL